MVIDFSNAALTEDLLAYCKARKLPVVICTTGHSPEQVAMIEAASKEIPVFRSGNMSVGINLMMDLLRKCASVLGADYNVEVVEAHHNQKLDAPSGTALMLADAVSESCPMRRRTSMTAMSAAKSARRTRSASTRSAAAPSSASTACCSAAVMRSSRSSTLRSRARSLPPEPCRPRPSWPAKPPRDCII